MKKSYNWSRPVDISILVGQTLTRIEGLAKRSEKVVWRTSDGKEYEMFHEQDCCETVELAEVIGDPEDLLGHPILRAEERTNSTEDPPKYADSWTSWTWTFYEISSLTLSQPHTLSLSLCYLSLSLFHSSSMSKKVRSNGSATWRNQDDSSLRNFFLINYYFCINL